MLARFKKANEGISRRRDKWLENISRKLDCKLCKIQEEILESCHECKANGAEISNADENGPGKDAQDRDDRINIIEKILESKCCGAKIQSKLDTDCESCGEATPVEDLEMVLIGNDVIAQFPNIKSKNTGRIVRHRVEKSPLEFEGFDYKQIHCCKSPIYRRSQRLMECLYHGVGR